ncbi:type I secretion system permease/ATPase [Roseospira navarrensis]|uniref:ATP-binding cassette domain-containing protein n=1 Tax=Roseospira navarrensis TaxID=140058 RepID=A0A7X2D3A7_9PROT|nr:ATP-binding cassette domain-containing protein [Roseospira navarrensis]MQX37179.1 ATP-binding cassette domain-containing protein [Roseospira navarrensis]
MAESAAARPGAPRSRADELKAALRRANGQVLAAGAFSLFVTLLVLVLPVFAFQLFERVLPSRSEQTLVMLMILAAGALAGMAILDMLRRLLLLRAGSALRHRLTGPVLDILVQVAGAGPRPETRQALGDVDVLCRSMGGRGQIATLDLVWFPVFLIALPLIDARLLLVAGLVSALMAVTVLMARPLTLRRAREAQRRDLAMRSQLEERLRHAPSVAVMGMAPMIARRWRRAADARQRDDARIAVRLTALAMGTALLRHLGVVAVLGAAAWLYTLGDVTEADVIAAGLVADRAFAVLEGLIWGWGDVMAARGARDRLMALFEASPPARDSMPLPVPAGALAVQQAVVAPPGGRVPVLKGLSFDLPPGGSLGVIGPSGAGKSTLARALVGLWPPAQGKVRLDGNDLRNWNTDQLGRHVGYVSQDIDLMDGTVAENIARMGVVEAADVIQAARRVGLHETLLRLPNGYDTPIGENGHVLPAGLRQRVALARALYGDPRLIVLDEPNAFLDSEGEQALLQTLAALRNEGRTVVMVTQKPALLTALETVLVLRDGQVEMMGPCKDILAKFARGGAPGAGQGGSPKQVQGPAPGGAGSPKGSAAPPPGRPPPKAPPSPPSSGSSGGGSSSGRLGRRPPDGSGGG